jgi:serine/threonine-protein kinase
VAPDSLVGTVLGERYELIERAGRGGTAVVYRALDQRLGRTVAVKIIHDTLVGDEDYTRRFDREARAAARLSHPNIVAIFDRGLTGERPYIVMEYIRGQSLRQIIAQQAPLAPLVALSYVEAIAKALSAAHEAGLMHRDIKPENVLITPSGQVKVTDFGLAKASHGDDSMTHSVLMGTISYLAPEIPTLGVPQYSSDVYAAGIVLYELLTGHKPHTGEEAANILYKHVNVDVPPPSESLTGAAKARIPDYLDALVQACTNRDPALRPVDGRALERDIAQVKRRLIQGVASDPAFAAALKAGRRRLESTTVIVPDDASELIAEEEATTTAQLPPGALDDADEWLYYHSELTPAPERDRPLRQATGRAQPLLQVNREPKYRRRRAGLVALLIVLVLGLVGGGSAFWWFRTGRWTEQPVVTGLSADAATATLTEAGFGVGMEQAYSETVPAGLVISSQPGDGERIVKGSTVTLTISLGAERYTLPELRGMTEQQARDALAACDALPEDRAEKCPAIGTVTPVWDDYVAEGIIVWMSAEAGAELPPGSVIDITVSQGPEPIEIADYTGQPLADAQAALEALQFVVTVTQEHSATVPEGSVVSQTPNSGIGHHGDTIALVESLGPVMVEVPNVVGDRRADAEATLRAIGLNPVISEMGGYTVFGLVFSQDPRAGAVVPEGSNVTLTMV